MVLTSGGGTIGSPDGILGAGSTTLGPFIESCPVLVTSSSALVVACDGDLACGDGGSVHVAIAIIVTKAVAFDVFYNSGAGMVAASPGCSKPRA
jgi:hypothetical protein